MNEEAKKNVLRKIPYGLYVIGVKDGASKHAFTGSWFSQCSMKPPRVMLGVRSASQSLEMIKTGKVFSVNLMPKTDKKILEQFFKPTPSDGNRFGDVAFRDGVTGAPILERAVGYLECRLHDVFETGDHTVVVGEIVEAGATKDEAPLVMSDTPWHYGG